VVIFTLDDQLYALPINNVLRVIHALRITALPKAPDVVSGIINVKGQIIPVVDMRKRFRLVVRDVIPDDNFILANTGKRDVALWIDRVKEVKEIAAGGYSDTRASLPYVEFVKGVAKIENEFILIYDLEQCLSLSEEVELEHALSNRM
jgi:purine-binding chemotaxis protein CheW